MLERAPHERSPDRHDVARLPSLTFASRGPHGESATLFPTRPDAHCSLAQVSG